MYAYYAGSGVEVSKTTALALLTSNQFDVVKLTKVFKAHQIEIVEKQSLAARNSRNAAELDEQYAAWVQYGSNLDSYEFGVDEQVPLTEADDAVEHTKQLVVPPMPNMWLNVSFIMLGSLMQQFGESGGQQLHKDVLHAAQETIESLPVGGLFWDPDAAGELSDLEALSVAVAQRLWTFLDEIVRGKRRASEAMQQLGFEMLVSLTLKQGELLSIIRLAEGAVNGEFGLSSVSGSAL